MHDGFGEVRREERVFVVDANADSRAETVGLLREVGFRVEAFRDCGEFLARVGPEHAGCLLLDVGSCVFSELRLHERIASDQILLPVVAIASRGDVSTAVAAMKAGAADCVERPFDPEELTERVNHALARDRERRHENVALSRILARVERLTRREREVMELVVAGHPNKVIAQLLRISPRTVEVHRARVMEKMQARSVSELVRAAMIMNLGAGAMPAAQAQSARLPQ